MSTPGAMTLKDAAVKLAALANESFHTSESSGTENWYLSKFEFKTLEAMQNFESAWIDFNTAMRDELIAAAIVRDPSLAEVVARPGGARNVGTDELNRAAAAMEMKVGDESHGPTAEDTERVVETMETIAASVPVTVHVRVPEEAAEYMDKVSMLCGEHRDTVASVMFAMASLRPGFLEKGPLPTGDSVPPDDNLGEAAESPKDKPLCSLMEDANANAHQ